MPRSPKKSKQEVPPPAEPAQPAEEEQEQAAPAAPVPTLETLPSFAHDMIAACLPDGDEKETRLRLSLASRAMLAMHGGTLTALTLSPRQRTDYRVENLLGLVQRQHSLRRMHASSEGPALGIILAQGCLHQLQELSVHDIAREHIPTLAAAMRMPGALQSLEVLKLTPKSGWHTGMLPVLAEALTSDVAPSLRVLDLAGRPAEDRDLEAFAQMLETRAQLPACRGLLQLKWYRYTEFYIWGEASLCRLFPFLLPTMEEFGPVFWRTAYTACFVAVPAPRLKKFIHNHDGGVIPVEVWESMLGLEELQLQSSPSGGGVRDVINPVVAALDRGVAFQQLQKLVLSELKLEAPEWEQLLRALEGATCAAQLSTLSITRCQMCPASMTMLSKLLGQDAFPILKELRLSHGILEDGVAALARGLLAAPCTRLAFLDMQCIEASDVDIAALASLVREGHFEGLKHFALTGMPTVTDKGIFLFAKAVEDTGLPMLSKCAVSDLQGLTAAGMGVLAHVLIKSCPKLTRLDLRCFGANRRGRLNMHMLKEMVLAAGAKDRLHVEGIVWEEAS